MAWENDWEKTRKWGRLKYSILHGFSFSLLISLAMLALDVYDHKEVSLVNTVIFMLLNLIGWGSIEYFLIWPLSERHYKKKKQPRL
jgi:Na+/glutamate symporter